MGPNGAASVGTIALLIPATVATDPPLAASNWPRGVLFAVPALAVRDKGAGGFKHFKGTNDPESVIGMDLLRGSRIDFGQPVVQGLVAFFLKFPGQPVQYLWIGRS